jgi:hypothetical protein
MPTTRTLGALPTAIAAQVPDSNAVKEALQNFWNDYGHHVRSRAPHAVYARCPAPPFAPRAPHARYALLPVPRTPC